MKVLITDGLAKEGIDRLIGAGYEVVQKKLSLPQLIKEIPAYDALIVKSATKVTGEVIAAAEKMKIIGRAGIGVDNVDVEAATEMGIVVKNAPGSSTNAVVELTVVLMLALARNVVPAYLTLKEGTWLKKPYQGIELNKKTLGIIGCGRIGKKLAETANQAFNMRVIGFDPLPIEDGRIEPVELNVLLRDSDFISLHLPGQKAPVIGKVELRKMKKEAFLINTSRGKNLDEDALYRALKERRIAGAACDVYREEGKENQDFVNNLFELDNFVGLPHIGASTTEAQAKAAIEVAEGVIGYLRNGDWKGAINVGERISHRPEPIPVYQLWVLHEDVPGMFHKILGVLKSHRINVYNIPAEGMAGKAQGIFRIGKKPSAEVIKEIEALEGVRRVVD